MKTKYKNFNVKVKNTNDDDFTIDVIMSAPIEDRHGDVVENSWQLDNFKANPVVQFGHRHDIPAVGKVVDITMNEVGQLTGRIKFAAQEFEFANTLYKLYKNKFMRAVSIGYIPHEIEEVKDDKGMFGKERHLKNELLELSVVNVPANALALAKQKGIDLNPLTELNNLVKQKDDCNKCPDKDEEVKRLKKKANRLIKAVNTLNQEKKDRVEYVETLETQIESFIKPKKKTKLNEAKEAIEQAEKTIKHQDPVKLMNKAVRLLLEEKKTLKKDITSSKREVA